MSVNDQSRALAKARIVKVTEGGSPINNTAITCMFNPYEYTLAKSNSFTEQKVSNGKNTPKAELSQAGSQTLKLTLIFDTYGSGDDVSLITDRLWRFMRVSDDARPDRRPAGKHDKREVPLVAFHWGVFFFVSYLTSMTQRFTLFTPQGIPVRAKVDVTFTQYTDIEDRNEELRQNPTSGGGPINRVHRVVSGDRLDLIAHDAYRDAGKWRLIAAYNNLNDPLHLRPGQILTLPFEEDLI